jgi:hypothetical protein
VIRPVVLSGEASDQLREYQDIANWDDGIAVHETEQIVGEGGPNPVAKRCIGLVPLGGQVDYYTDMDQVINRLSAAALQLVANYNGARIKKSLEWKDLICRQDWVGRRGRQETTLFQVELSTYNFFKMAFTGPKPPMTVSDVKVRRHFSQPLLDISLLILPPLHSCSLRSPPR